MKLHCLFCKRKVVIYRQTLTPKPICLWQAHIGRYSWPTDILVGVYGELSFLVHVRMFNAHHSLRSGKVMPHGRWFNGNGTSAVLKRLYRIHRLLCLNRTFLTEKNRLQHFLTELWPSIIIITVAVEEKIRNRGMRKSNWACLGVFHT